MTANVGGIDRILRIVLGLVLVALAATGTVGLWGWIGLVPLLTGAVTGAGNRISRTAQVPLVEMAPASEAVKAPRRMPSTTNTGTSRAGMASRNARMRSGQGIGRELGSRPRRRACTCTVSIKAAAITTRRR